MTWVIPAKSEQTEGWSTQFFVYLFDYDRRLAWKWWIPARQDRYFEGGKRDRRGRIVRPYYPNRPACLGMNEVHRNDLAMYPNRKKVDYDQALARAFPKVWAFKVRR